MGVRPPQDNDEEPEIVEFGIAAVDARLDRADLTFPATADDVVTELGGREIPYDAAGRSLPLRNAIDQTGRERFDTRQELLNALHPVFEEHRNQPLGVVARLRSLLPF